LFLLVFDALCDASNNRNCDHTPTEEYAEWKSHYRLAELASEYWVRTEICGIAERDA
jgi:hypothetical protein